ncbi:hypothetical protein KS4_26450 [Poriferisphaera corsica]|uniref:Prepilin-type N-terminal cleavage/methylation domain-containing protein n=1 Tax=Poriferisphaera corsica TaxID=2528020 RepID=A0A517YWG9_9BACT|nr:prepilin-type N-terminal cleavage/methylation domain-containing protein [Poriferisphaera corsica]QDU34575.1 hypothetical protein KS4_26450 [Poriferisphaera corsica]
MRYFKPQNNASQYFAGFTLVEVLAALVLLSLLFVGVVGARSRYLRQSARARSRLLAIDKVDDLLASWWMDETYRIKAGQQGQLIDDATIQLIWQIVPVKNIPNLPAFLAIEVVRLEVVDKMANKQDGEVVLSVDLLVSDLEMKAKLEKAQKSEDIETSEDSVENEVERGGDDA